MAKATDSTTTETTETEGPQGLSIVQMAEKIKTDTGKDINQQNLRATLRNLVKKGDLVHEPRTRWAFDDADAQVVVDHYNKAEPAEGDEKPKAKSKGKAKAKDEAPAEDSSDDDDDLDLEDI